MPGDDRLTVGSLFTGAALLDYGLHLAGYDHRWFCERDADRRAIIARRFPGRPVYPDVTALADALEQGLEGPGDVRAAAERVDVVAGGFPCKGVSKAGRGDGFAHPETALWREMLRVVRALRPRYVLVENVADLLTRAPRGGHRGELFSEVLGGLAALGYDAEWDCFPAAAFGAPHRRDRVFVTAFADPGSGRIDADGRVRPGDHRGGDSPRRALVSTGPEVARPADAVEDHADAAADAELVAGAAPRERVAGPGAGGVTPASGGPGETLSRATRGGDEAAADADGDRLFQQPPLDRPHRPVDIERGDDTHRRDARIDWGGYEAAIRRWEVILGRPAPEPMLRRVDDGGARRMDRPRLSALGDGVLVQAGWLVGVRLMLYHLALMQAAAPGREALQTTKETEQSAPSL